MTFLTYNKSTESEATKVSPFLPKVPVKWYSF
jgi:hypothetical protein